MRGSTIGLPVALLVALAMASEPGAAGEKPSPSPSKPKLAPVLDGEQWSYEKIIEHLGYNLQFIDGVVWVIDQSPSMQDDVDTVRGELGKWLKILKNDAKVGLVGYSDKPHVLLKPTADREQVTQAFASYRTQESSEENLYKAIALASRILPKGEQLAIVVATDEVGDDERFLSAALRALNRRHIAVYVISPNATFGNRRWHWNEIHFDRKDTRRLHSSNGPETGTPEALFSFDFVQRSQWSKLIYPMDTREWATRAGWAPYNLQMLARSTGGTVYNLETNSLKLAGPFVGAHRYRPDFAEPKKLLSNIRSNPWRQAVHKVASAWQKSFKPLVREVAAPFPAKKEAALLHIKKRDLPTVQHNKKLIRQSMVILRDALLQDSWSGMDKDPSVLRWRANLELAYANCLVAYFHCLQFEADVARFAKPNYAFKPLFDIPNPGNALGHKIVCVPDDASAITSGVDPDGSKKRRMLYHADHKDIKDLKSARVLAEAALGVVISNHHQTPWATLAESIRSRMGRYEIRSMPAGTWNSGEKQQ